MSMKKIKGFTLVELLIVMGILAILMTIGISVGRFAIQRANNIQHQAAVDQFGQAIQSYYTDNRHYPATILGTSNFPDDDDAALSPYIDASFDGGSPASFYYETNITNQAYLVCVAYGGQSDIDNLGFYCTGDGFGEEGIYSGAVLDKEVEWSETESAAYAAVDGDDPINWNGSDWGDE